MVLTNQYLRELSYDTRLLIWIKMPHLSPLQEEAFQWCLFGEEDQQKTHKYRAHLYFAKQKLIKKWGRIHEQQ